MEFYESMMASQGAARSVLANMKCTACLANSGKRQEKATLLKQGSVIVPDLTKSSLHLVTIGQKAGMQHEVALSLLPVKQDLTCCQA